MANKNVTCKCRCHASDRFHCNNECCHPCQYCGLEKVSNFNVAAGGDYVCQVCFDPDIMTASVDELDLS